MITEYCMEHYCFALGALEHLIGLSTLDDSITQQSSFQSLMLVQAAVLDQSFVY